MKDEQMDLFSKMVDLRLEKNRCLDAERYQQIERELAECSARWNQLRLAEVQIVQKPL